MKAPAPMRIPKLIVAEAYDQIAERYLEWRAQQPREGELARWLGLLRERVRPGARILDIGCGAGIPLTLALSETFDVTGVDVSTRQIELARKNVPAARFIHGDVTTSDFAVASFDAAVASYSLIHVPRGEHVGLFRSIARWLSTDGVCSRTSEWALKKLTPMKIGSARRSFGAVLMLMESVPH
jgi:SAM-dependent methyltransferase